MGSVLILTAGYGERHNAAARGLKEGFDLLGGSRAEVLDLFAPAFGSFYQRSRAHYLRILSRSPRLWTNLSAALDKFPFTSQLLAILRPLKRELARVLKEYRPDAVISVFPAYAHLLPKAGREAGHSRFKSYVLVTDSIAIHSLWYKCDAATFLVPNEDTATVLRAASIGLDRLFVSGFPVSTKYSLQTEARPEPGGNVPPRVLYMVNGQPGRAVPLVESLLRKGAVELTVCTGKNEELKKNLGELAARMHKPLNVMEWTPNMPQLLRRNHLVIGDAGGATVPETLAAQTPMLITHIPPGSDEGSARHLLQNGCGAHCPTNEAVLRSVESLFDKGAQGWHQMHRHACALGRPDAALTTARWITQRIKTGKTDNRAGFGLRAGRQQA